MPIFNTPMRAEFLLSRLGLLILLQIVGVHGHTQQRMCTDHPAHTKELPAVLPSGELLWPSSLGPLLSNGEHAERLIESINGIDLDGRVTGVYADSQHVLMHYQDHGLLHLTADTMLLLPKNDHAHDAIGDREANAFCRVGDTMYIACYKGVSLYDLTSRRILDHLKPADLSGLEPLPKMDLNVIRDIKQDRRDPDILWMGGTAGLFQYHAPSGNIERHYMGPEFLQHLDAKERNRYSIMLTEICQLEDAFYFSSWGGGIVRYNQSEGIWTLHRYQKHVIDRTVRTNITFNIIQFNDTLGLVTCHNHPPVFFHFEDLRFIPFDSIIGIKPETATNIGAVLNGGYLYLGYNDQICRYTSKTSFSVQNTSGGAVSMLINGVAYDGQRLDHYRGFNRHLPERLKSYQRSLTFQFKGLYIDHQDIKQIEAQIENPRNTWVNVTSGNSVTFSELPGGRNTLKVRAILNDGRSIDSEPYTFYIERYFWERWEFYLFGLLLIAAVVLPVYFQIRRLRMEKRKAELAHNMELSETRLMAMRSQMNPHFLFNSLSAINNFIIHSDPKTASDYLTKFAHLMRRILENSREPLITVQQELETLRLYMELENVRFSHHICFVESIDRDIEANSTYIPAMVIQPYIENAIIHGIMPKRLDGTIELSMSLTDECTNLIIIITDDGIGRKKSTEKKKIKQTKHKSVGMKLTENRLELMERLYRMQTDVVVEDVLNECDEISGTRVTLKLPYIKEKPV